MIRFAVLLALAFTLVPTLLQAASLPLSVRKGSLPAVVDSEGRTVLLRGTNLNSLGDYYAANPAYPTVIPATEEDFERMASLGFNVVRLLVSWSFLEPQPNVIDEAYIAKVRQHVLLAKKYGMYTVIDMHQDAWGKHIASNGTEDCGFFERSIGWDGAPAWATLTQGRSTCKYRVREISPAVATAWENFWRNKQGIQDHMIRVWARLAREFAAEPAVAGYDLINEPNFGLSVGISQTLFMGNYYTKALRAIRAAEKSVPGGFSHIGFFEPSVEWSAFGTTLFPLGLFMRDPNIVFAPHLYSGSITIKGDIASGYKNAANVASVYRTPIWSGEWGWFGDPVSSEASIWTYAQHEDKYLIGGAVWQWKQACGDPHTQGRWGGTDPVGNQNQLNITFCPGDVDLGVNPAYQRVLARAFPQHAPGALTALGSDPYTGKMTMSGNTQSPGIAKLWVPASGRVNTPVISGGSVQRITSVKGGYIAEVRVEGIYRIAVDY
jgi:endoglycosylceramidase